MHPGTAAVQHGTLGAGVSLVLPPSGDDPHEVCFSVPSVPGIEAPAPVCLELEVPRTVVAVELRAPDVLARGPVPGCAAVCVSIPVTADGPPLHPVLVAEDGVELASLRPASLDLTVMWRDLVTDTTGSFAVTAARATEFGGLPKPRHADGAFPYAYVGWPGTYAVGDVLEFTVAAAATTMYEFAPGAALHARVVHTATTLTLGAPATVESGAPLVLSGMIEPGFGPILPRCCNQLPSFSDPAAPVGEFAAEVTRLDGTTPLTIPVALTGAGPGSLTTATGELAAPEEPGSYEVRLRYLSDDARFADAAATRTVTVAKAATATSLAVDPSPGPSGTEWRLTSTTARVSAGTGDPTGWVEFSATVPGRGVVWSSTVPLDAATGLARADVGAATEALPPGTVTFRARYAGDPARHGSEATRDVTVEPRAATPAVPRVPAPEPTPDGADAGAPPGATGGGSDAGGAGGGASPVAEPRDDVRAPVAVSLPLIAAGGLGLAALLVLLVLLRRRRRRTA